jgi:uncharacterized membrane protein
MKKTNWLLVGIIIVLALLLLFGGGLMFGGWFNHGYGMMGSYGGYGMMNNWGYAPFGWFGMGLGMLFMWLIPIGLVALVVFCIVSLVRNNKTTAPSTPQSSCPHCGNNVLTDWQNCPYCGTTLK